MKVNECDCCLYEGTVKGQHDEVKRKFEVTKGTRCFYLIITVIIINNYSYITINNSNILFNKTSSLNSSSNVDQF